VLEVRRVELHLICQTDSVEAQDFHILRFSFSHVKARGSRGGIGGCRNIFRYAFRESRVRRSLLRGSGWESFEIMTELAAQEAPSGSALQEFLTAFSVFALRVSLIINQLPWTSGFRGE